MGTPVFIAGPTASGKSAVALEIAQRLNGEIISVDSMQVYRGLDLGTAKPTAEERASVLHHHIDILELTEFFDAARFVARTKAIIKKIKAPVFCGGTGLYFSAWLEGLGKAPQANATMRAELEDVDLETLVAELLEHDPATHATIDRRNRRRVVRAVEVIRLTGKPFSEQRAEWTGQVPPNFFLLERGREDLRQRIDTRVEAMIAAGLVAETCSLRSALEGNPVAQQALGYRQVIGHLNDEQGLPETVALVKSRTWQFARRQMTWFRKLHGAHTLTVPANEPVVETARRLIEQLT
ncbi:MAG: tRNA (adenosine(37)-N6)-dimethylallyltransferase MiaA [Verrucomicrobiales bacterium]|jgi:tRNA dimethylallyltransferase|nr:tRNA (adenosine(37)-N6)-dimethylallyltransferase MiaA [Verrucomicrobiales bacterium]MBT6450228.1 tRNA (adenosine(37)-N6)-dimethylallyltransferase MiaA [Verrucomicrobiales bacterium]